MLLLLAKGTIFCDGKRGEVEVFFRASPPRPETEDDLWQNEDFCRELGRQLGGFVQGFEELWFEDGPVITDAPPDRVNRLIKAPRLPGFD